jgi:hypothetical protein
MQELSTWSPPKAILHAIWMLYGREKSRQFKDLLWKHMFGGRYTANRLITFRQMKNTASIARKWTEFLASRPELKAGPTLLAQFLAGDITRLCDCGCNGYEFKLRSGSSVAPLAPPTEKGCVAFQMAFQTETPETSVELLLFVDSSGNLAGLDVDFCGNTCPMPEAVSLVEPPYHVYGALARHA